MAAKPAISAPTSSAKSKPTIYIDLSKSDIGEIKGLEVEQEVKVTIKGKVVAVSMRSDDQGKTASLTVESNDVTVKDQTNKMADLLDDDGDEGA